MTTTEYNERILEDNYPTFPGYLYVVVMHDGTEKVVHNIDGRTVRDFKRGGKVKDVKSCDISGRNLWDRAL